ncbi:uncharacterized protein I303_106484 [Kwoniella dejecticola CBS 10117]|uniref:ABM domain-containing protein n=1 Tax=Kwoniella dejecticola CBS 10117 TaxID=1296121 RepID=A0A1A5ZUK7_9TREE|nr:uncharacterized protein I303_08258 [Kwoniella dejecticola CBS 10117]OBR81488.1 hypothetical protein I303_08258 [Kwoniella dejecticola CBS 10117]
MGFIVVLFLEFPTDKVDSIKSKLLHAAAIYRKDPETVEWNVQQDLTDPKKITLVEKYERESSLTEIHRKNAIYQETIDLITSNVSKPIEKHFIHT